MGISAIARGTAAATAAALALATLAATAQDGAEGGPNPLLTFGVQQRFTTDDNLDVDPASAGRSNLATTRLSFTYLSETRAARLAFDGGTSLRLTDGPDTDGTEFELDDTRLGLGYARDAANGSITFDASYAESQIDTLRSLSDFGPGIEVPEDFATLSGTGIRRSYGLKAGLQLNQGAPLSYGLSAGISGISYRDADDPDLFGSTRISLGASVGLQLSPATEGRVGLRYSDFSSDDPANDGGGTTGLDLDLTQSLPGGSLGGRIFVEDDGDDSAGDGGIRSGFSVTRAIDLPAGNLSASLGATRLPQADTELTGAFSWQQQLPQGSVSAALSRGVTQDSDDATRLVTALRLGYSQELTPLSQLSLDVSYALSESTAGPDQTESSSFGATYSRDVTEDWALDLGYRYRTRDEDAAGQGTSNSVFLALRRSFEIRP